MKLRKRLPAVTEHVYCDEMFFVGFFSNSSFNISYVITAVFVTRNGKDPRLYVYIYIYNYNMHRVSTIDIFKMYNYLEIRLLFWLPGLFSAKCVTESFADLAILYQTVCIRYNWLHSWLAYIGRHRQ